MLVLTRKTNEAVCIGADVQVIVLSVRGNEARLGIIAPANVAIDRDEVRRRKDAEQLSVEERAALARGFGA